MSYLAGIDIGGTKCAVTIGKQTGDHVEILYKEKFPTPFAPSEAVETLVDTLKRMVDAHSHISLEAVGISCGSPLDSKKGVILSPPNLPNWDHIDVVTPFEKAFKIPAGVQNDANACALAEWMWGAGRGTEHMLFLTFGTGLGAGMILNKTLYCGAGDMAGEIGHIRLSKDGPEGYGKNGSFEGFCSGGGIARYGAKKIEDWLSQGRKTSILEDGQLPQTVTTAQIGKAAEEGDALALEIFTDTGKRLGQGLAMLIDILNPQRIVIGSIFLRQESLLRKPMEAMIREEALSYARERCEIVPAGLGEQLGDYAALSVAGNLSGRSDI